MSGLPKVQSVNDSASTATAGPSSMSHINVTAGPASTQAARRSARRTGAWRRTRAVAEATAAPSSGIGNLQPGGALVSKRDQLAATVEQQHALGLGAGGDHRADRKAGGSGGLDAGGKGQAALVEAQEHEGLRTPVFEMAHAPPGRRRARPVAGLAIEFPGFGTHPDADPAGLGAGDGDRPNGAEGLDTARGAQLAGKHVDFGRADELSHAQIRRRVIDLLRGGGL